jgi:hypothetical protein
VCNEFSTTILIAFGSNALESFVTIAGTEKVIVDGGVVDGDESICLEEVEHFVKKVIGIAVDKA